MAKKQSPWKARLANMTDAEREAYKKADNERVAAYRAKKKAEREALKSGKPLPPPEPKPQRAPREKQHLAPESPAPADATPVPSRSLFTQYVGVGARPEYNLPTYSMPFHRSDFFELGLVPTDDVREIPRKPFSIGERLHEKARLYRATNEQRLVWLGVDDRAEEAAKRFTRALERQAAEPQEPKRRKRA